MVRSSAAASSLVVHVVGYEELLFAGGRGGKNAAEERRGYLWGIDSMVGPVSRTWLVNTQLGQQQLGSLFPNL